MKVDLCGIFCVAKGSHGANVHGWVGDQLFQFREFGGIVVPDKLERTYQYARF